VIKFNELSIEIKFRLGNLETGTNYGSHFPIASPTAESTVTSFGNGNYHPTSNYTPQLHGDSSSSLKLSSIQESSSQV